MNNARAIASPAFAAAVGLLLYRFAVLGGGALFEFLGVPPVAVLQVWLRHSHQHHVDSSSIRNASAKRSHYLALPVAG